jgi:hypothetical protein
MREICRRLLLATLIFLVEIPSKSGCISESVVTQPFAPKTDDPRNLAREKPLLQSFRPKGTKIVSAHGRNDDKEALKFSNNQSSVRIFFRALQLFFIFSPSISLAWLAILFPVFQSIWFRLLSFSLGHSGAAFIKWGQVAQIFEQFLHWNRRI